VTAAHDDADQPFVAPRCAARKAERHRRITWDAAARSCREILEAYRTELPVRGRRPCRCRARSLWRS